MRRVLVTGAGGFLGGWLVEGFLLCGIPVRAGVRRWNSAVRLARHPADVVLCDVLSTEQIEKAIGGCDCVVHCAMGGGAVSTDGTRNVLAAAQRHQVRRVIHLSSVAVYGRDAGMIDETHPRRGRGNRYAEWKIAAEEIAEQFIEQGLPVVILRPSIIYGPFSATWTVSFAKRLVDGKWGTMGEHGEGKCNLVYVTDVVQAIYRALRADDGVGEAFNINGPEIVTWNEYFRRFGAALGRPQLTPKNARRLALKARMLSPLRAAAKFALRRFEPALYRLRAQSAAAASSMRSTENLLRLTPTYEQVKLYGVDAEYVIGKSEKRLGYRPRVDLAHGMASSVAWLRQHGIVE